jgi:hypothetical protein
MPERKEKIRKQNRKTHKKYILMTVEHHVSLFHILIVLSFSRAADAIMFSVGWQVEQSTTSLYEQV